MSTKDHRTELLAAPGSGPGSGNPHGTGTGGGQPVGTAGPVARPDVAGEPPRSRPALRGALGGRGRRRLAAVLALLVVAAVVAGVVLSTRPSPGRPASGVPVTGTATVQRRNLVETDTESGTISYANPQTVYNQLSGTITWLPSAGQLIKPGHPLYEVDAQPVILMNGTTPAYRELTSSDSDGRDILQLNRNLVKLGFNPGGIVIDDAWQPATTVGVAALQASLGQAETGSLSLGQVVFLPGDQIISAVGARPGSAGGGPAPILQTTSTQLIVTVDLPASSQSEAKVGERVTVENAGDERPQRSDYGRQPDRRQQLQQLGRRFLVRLAGDDSGDNQAEGTRHRGRAGSGAGQRELRGGRREQRPVGSGHCAAGDPGRQVCG